MDGAIKDNQCIEKFMFLIDDNRRRQFLVCFFVVVVVHLLAPFRSIVYFVSTIVNKFNLKNILQFHVPATSMLNELSICLPLDYSTFLEASTETFCSLNKLVIDI